MPFGAALFCALLLHKLRLAGVSAVAGFLAAVFLVGNFALEPLTATRKIVLVASAAGLAGAAVDLVSTVSRRWLAAFSLLIGLAAVWVFWSILAQKSLPVALLTGGAIVFVVCWLIAATVTLHADPVRAGAAGLALGLGSGIAAVLGASALLGQYGIALGAACGAFLLLAMIMGGRIAAGAALTLPAAVLSSLICAAGVLLAQVHWSAVVAMLLVPVAVRLPVPERRPAWMQAVVASAYGLSVAGLACALAWFSSRGASA